ncbi:MAG: hypothetical protein U5K84_14510 [Alkalibacterium sp.]|nr:hypothetical protein [Alkalibacterium sp.]
MSVLASVREAAETIKYRFDHIDCLINNAGMVSTSKEKSADGYELTTATNYIVSFVHSRTSAVSE